MNHPNIQNLAVTIDAAARDAVAIDQFTEQQRLTVDDAYEIQAASIALRQARGEKIVGMKMGLTSRAKMAQVGVDSVTWGRLSDAMLVTDGGSICMNNFVHPRAEPEIAFLMGAPLSGRVTPVEAMAAVAGVAPAVEIIDSRFQNFKFALADVIADNSSSSGFVVGSWSAPGTDLSNLAMTLLRNGRAEQIGSSAAILGNPVRSLVEAARMIAESGGRIEPGWIVLAGAATAAIALAEGDSIKVTVESLGSASFSVD